MTILCFMGDRNKSGKSDWSGAFLPESNAFMRLHGIPEDNRLKVNLGYSEPHRATEVLDFIKAKLNPSDEHTTLAFFCHGLSYKIQLGFNKQNVDRLSSALREALGPDVKSLTIILYCCSTGAGAVVGDGGFADTLKDNLCQHGFTNCKVVGHSQAGHTVSNPFCRLFEGLGSSVGGTGGLWIVAPFSKPLWKKWCVALKTDFRFRFPFLNISQIHEELLK